MVLCVVCACDKKNVGVTMLLYAAMSPSLVTSTYAEGRHSSGTRAQARVGKGKGMSEGLLRCRSQKDHDKEREGRAFRCTNCSCSGAISDIFH